MQEGFQSLRAAHVAQTRAALVEAGPGLLEIDDPETVTRLLLAALTGAPC